MEILEELTRRRSKEHTEQVARLVGRDPKRFGELMKGLFGEDPLIAQRAAWVVCYSSDEYPEIILPWMRQMTELLERANLHPSLRRTVLRSFRRVEIPPRLLGRIVSRCFEIVADVGEPIAVRMYAMTVLGNIALKKPELAHELRESVLHLGADSPGLRVGVRETLKKLDRLEGKETKRGTERRKIADCRSERGYSG